MRKIIYTVSVDPGRCFKCCVDSQQKYAEKIKADFLVRNSWQNWNDDLKTDCEKRYIVELLKYYDRVLYLDADVLVKEAAPDIFDVYKNTDDLIMYNEILYNGVTMNYHIAGLVKKYNIKWHKTNDKYDWLNAGVMLCSKKSIPAFNYNHNDFFKFDKLPMIYDMPYMHKNIYDNNIQITFLDKQFNTMIYFTDKGWFLHFANVLDRNERIKAYV